MMFAIFLAAAAGITLITNLLLSLCWLLNYKSFNQNASCEGRIRQPLYIQSCVFCLRHC